MKTNFKKIKPQDSSQNNTVKDEINDDISKEQWEEFVVKSGAKGSFMIYRSKKKHEELGLDEL